MLVVKVMSWVRIIPWLNQILGEGSRLSRHLHLPPRHGSWSEASYRTGNGVSSIGDFGAIRPPRVPRRAPTFSLRIEAARITQMAPITPPEITSSLASLCVRDNDLQHLILRKRFQALLPHRLRPGLIEWFAMGRDKAYFESFHSVALLVFDWHFMSRAHAPSVRRHQHRSSRVQRIQTALEPRALPWETAVLFFRYSCVLCVQQSAVNQGGER